MSDGDAANVDPTDGSVSRRLSDEKPKRDFWALTNALADAGELLRFVQRDKANDDAIVVFDASVLLTPYEAKTPIDGLEAALSAVAKQGRLFVPGQAIREFYINRSKKLEEIDAKIDSIVQFLTKNDPFQNMTSILRMDERLSEAWTLYKESRKRAADAQAVFSSITHGGDELTEMYARVFKNAIFEPKWDDEDRSKIEAEFHERASIKFPPGYKDGGRNGDYLIWRSLLSIADKTGRDCIFVVQDNKGNWSSNKARGGHKLKAELLAEYYHVSSGGQVFPVALSEFMSSVGVNAEQVIAMQTAEEASKDIRSVFIEMRNRLDELSRIQEELHRQIAQAQTLREGYRYGSDKRIPPPSSDPTHSQRLEELAQAAERREAAVKAADERIARLEHQAAAVGTELNSALTSYGNARRQLLEQGIELPA